MAIDKLGLYNDALILLGQRALSSLTEDRPSRYHLDSVYNLNGLQYCLEIVKPPFSRKVVALTTSTTSTEHDLDNVYTLPTDFVATVAAYSDSKLDDEIGRFIVSGNTLACEHSAIHLRYVSSDFVTTLTNWSASFARVVSAYLAREICIKVAPDQYADINNLFVDRVEIAKQLDQEAEPVKRSAGTTVTLTNTWRHIYNDALLILGLDEISSNNDDSNRRSKLDRAIDSDLVQDLLEDIGWTFATTATKSQYDPSIEPSWGYRRVHQKPAGMLRIDGLFSDEHLTTPLKQYHDDGDYFLTDHDDIYVSYVSSSFLTTPDTWPAFFRRLVAARLAKDTAPSLRREGADIPHAQEVWDERRHNSMSNDAAQAPPRVIANGSWVNARQSRSSNRGRP